MQTLISELSIQANIRLPEYVVVFLVYKDRVGEVVIVLVRPISDRDDDVFSRFHFPKSTNRELAGIVTCSVPVCSGEYFEPAFVSVLFLD